MPQAPEFPDYTTVYSKQARPVRDALTPDLRSALDKIEDSLAEDPEGHPSRTITLSDDLFIYKHPDPHIEVTYRLDRENKTVYLVHIVAPKLELAKPLFISYSHKDERWLLELKKWLKPLSQRDLIAIWDDTELEAGEDWRAVIEQALATAKAAVLLVSQDFLASDFIAQKELPVLLDKAKNEGLSILWIAVSTSTVEDTEISDYEAVLKEPPLDCLKPARRNKEFRRIYKKIQEVVGK